MKSDLKKLTAAQAWAIGQAAANVADAVSFTTSSWFGGIYIYRGFAWWDCGDPECGCYGEAKSETEFLYYWGVDSLIKREAV